MNKLIIAVSLSLAPALAFAGAPKSVAAKIAAAVRKLPEAKGLKGVNAKDTSLRYFNGNMGTFNINAYRPEPLPATAYTVSGDFIGTKLSNVHVTLTPLVPLAMTK